MSTISGLGTTYNLPNYTGILFQLTPADTPFFSAIGGINGGGQITSTEAEWETFDLRNPSQPAILEGAAAPTAQERSRANVTNVPQIHQEKVSVSYSKLAAVGLKNGTNNDLSNPVANELDWQVVQMLKQMSRDIEYSFINGVYQKPSDNTTARKTRGLIAAMTSNVTANATSTITGLSAATDTVTETATALANGDKIVFTDVGASTTLVLGRTYFVQSKATNTFKVGTSLAGGTVTIGTATVSYRKPWVTALAKSHVDALAQQVYDNGGVAEQSTATLIVNSTQKIALSNAYANFAGKYVENNRNVGGVNVDTIVTDMGTFNVMLNRYVPQDAIILASLEQCRPFFLETPGKGHFYAEPLAKVGASDDVQLYGEVGLAYGNQAAHGILTGLAI